MQEAALLRLLDLVQRKLGADDVRAELGGRDPEDEHLVWCSLDGGFRIVAVFSEVPADRDARSRRLEVLVRSFAGTLEGGEPERPAISSELASRRLDDALDALADRAGAVSAVVIDAQSPVVWGTSGTRRGDEDVETSIRTAEAAETAVRAGVDFAALLEREPTEVRALLEQRGVDPEIARFLAREAERIRQASRRSIAAWRHHLLTARAIAAVRREVGEPSAYLREAVREESFGYLARAFANIYRLLLVFEGPFSELHAEAALVHALPHIERLVLALPPVEPPPRGERARLRPVPND